MDRTQILRRDWTLQRVERFTYYFHLTRDAWFFFEISVMINIIRTLKIDCYDTNFLPFFSFLDLWFPQDQMLMFYFFVLFCLYKAKKNLIIWTLMARRPKRSHRAYNVVNIQCFIFPWCVIGTPFATLITLLIHFLDWPNFNITMKENRSENLEGDFFSFFYSALFSYLFFYSTLLVKEINHGLVAVNHKDGYHSPK